MKKFILSQLLLLLCISSAFSQAVQTLDERLTEAIDKNLSGWRAKNPAAPFDFVRGVYSPIIESDWVSSGRGANLRIYLTKSPGEIEEHFRSFLMRSIVPPNRKIEGLGDRAQLVETANRVEVKILKGNLIAGLEMSFPDSRSDKKLPAFYAPAPKEEVEKALKFARVVADAIDGNRTFSFCSNDFYRLKFPETETAEQELIIAVRRGEVETIKSLIAENVNVNGILQNGETALHLAVRQGCAETVKALIAAKADVNAKTSKGETPLMIAAAYGDLELVKELISRGAEVNGKDTYGRNAAFYVISLMQGVRPGFAPASTEDKIALIKYFASQKLNLNEKDTHDGDTLLTAMLYNCGGSPECKTMINLLLDSGVDVNAENKYGKTALIYAVNRMNQMVQNEFVRLLLARGARPDHKDKNNLSVLSYALKNQKLYATTPGFSEHAAETVRLLKDAGAIE